MPVSLNGTSEKTLERHSELYARTLHTCHIDGRFWQQYNHLQRLPIYLA